jgi:hypothetical protein
MSLAYYYIMGKGGAAPPTPITESINFSDATAIGRIANNFGVGTSFPITVTFWYKKLTNPNVFNVILNQRAPSGIPQGICIQFNPNFSASYGNGSSFYYVDSSTALTGIDVFDWNFYVCEYLDASTMKVQINNGTIYTLTNVVFGTPTTITTAVETTFGKFTTPFGSDGTHYEYDVRIFNRSLSAGEKTSIMAKNRIGDEAAIAGNASGSTWEDMTGNGFDVPLSGGFIISTDIPT